MGPPFFYRGAEVTTDSQERVDGSPVAAFGPQCIFLEARPCKAAHVPRYFIHTNHPTERNIQDDEGLEFASIHDAKCQAVVYAGELLRDVAEHFWDDADFELTVTDDKGLILFSMRVIGVEAPAVRMTSR